MRKELFRGAATALVTPFSDGGVDYRALKRLAGYQVSHGADALVVCGTTGESPTLSALEKLRCVSAVCEEVGGRIPVIAGTGTNDTGFSGKAVASCLPGGSRRRACRGAVLQPPTADGMTGHFLKIAESCGEPLILYNVPSRTGSDIPDAVLESLCKTGAVCGIKEASGSVSRAARIIGRYGKYIDLYSGNDDLTLPLLSIGAKGVISVASNILPLELHELCRLWFEGRHRRVRKALLRASAPHDRSVCREQSDTGKGGDGTSRLLLRRGAPAAHCRKAGNCRGACDFA